MASAFGSFFFGYLLGSIPFGLILTWAAGKGDIRSIGSGNIGATNVLRTGSKKLAALTLLLDAGKGFVAVYAMGAIGNGMDLGIDHWAYDVPILAAGLGAFLGHLFPVWLRFRGGKGVSTALGIFFGLSLWLGLAACVVWLLVAFAFRFSSLAALTATVAAPAIAWYVPSTLPGGLIDAAPRTGFVAAIGVLVWIRHRQNIRRLLGRTEPRIDQHAAPAA